LLLQHCSAKMPETRRSQLPALATPAAPESALDQQGQEVMPEKQAFYLLENTYQTALQAPAVIELTAQATGVISLHINGLMQNDQVFFYGDITLPASPALDAFGKVSLQSDHDAQEITASRFGLKKEGPSQKIKLMSHYKVNQNGSYHFSLNIKDDDTTSAATSKLSITSGQLLAVVYRAKVLETKLTDTADSGYFLHKYINVRTFKGKSVKTADGPSLLLGTDWTSLDAGDQLIISSQYGVKKAAASADCKGSLTTTLMANNLVMGKSADPLPALDTTQTVELLKSYTVPESGPYQINLSAAISDDACSFELTKDSYSLVVMIFKPLARLNDFKDQAYYLRFIRSELKLAQPLATGSAAAKLKQLENLRLTAKEGDLVFYETEAHVATDSPEHLTQFYYQVARNNNEGFSPIASAALSAGQSRTHIYCADVAKVKAGEDAATGPQLQLATKITGINALEKPALVESFKIITRQYRKISLPLAEEDNPLQVLPELAGTVDENGTSSIATINAEQEGDAKLLWETTQCPYLKESGSLKVAGGPEIPVPYPFTLFKGDLRTGDTAEGQKNQVYEFIVRAGRNYHTNTDPKIMMPGEPAPAHYSEDFYTLQLLRPESKECSVVLAKK
jgi:hypothetical protein